ncbi:MAG: histidine phosphatase family protein, partial [Oxalobacteraceae bacterium]
VPNCSVTSYEYDRSLGKRGKLAVRLINFVAPLEASGTPVTASKDMPAAPKA